MVRNEFEWDPQKARWNRRKHGVGCEQAATVFRNPRAASLYDQEHSEAEDRWITLGISATGKLLVVNHTFQEVDDACILIRIFSCRKAATQEREQYGE